jgi:glycosyltransferase involved in cell wall biosynthesis
MPAAPSISVILVCKNPGPRVKAALGSIWQQLHVHPEIIVVDGGSTDGSRAWLESQRERLTTLISEPDAGIYPAMNKGVARATGDWILFLGADDRLVGDMVLSESVNWMKKTEAGVAAGEVAYDDGRIYKLRSHVNPCARNFVRHQGTFYRRSLFAENDGFDPALAVMADYDFNVRLWKNRVRFKPIPLRIAACGAGGRSDSGQWLGYREEIAVRHRYFPFFRCLVWDALSLLRFARQQFSRRPTR